MGSDFFPDGVDNCVEPRVHTLEVARQFVPGRIPLEILLGRELFQIVFGRKAFQILLGREAPGEPFGYEPAQVGLVGFRSLDVIQSPIEMHLSAGGWSCFYEERES